MYAYSEQFHDVDGSPFPITLNELDSKVGEIRGEGVTLRPLRKDDAQTYFNLVDFDRAHLSQFADTTAAKYQTVEDVLKSMDESDENYNPFKLRFGIWADDTMVGSINLTPGSQNHIAEIGYWVGKQFIGHKYAAKAVNTLADFAFNGLGYTELEAEVAMGNEASKKTLEKCGFEDGGVRGYENFGDQKSHKHNQLYWVFTKTKSDFA